MTFISSEDELLLDEIMVIGGSKLYSYFNNVYGYDKIYLTDVDLLINNYDSVSIDDDFIDSINEMQLINEIKCRENNINYTFKEYIK